MQPISSTMVESSSNTSGKKLQFGFYNDAANDRILQYVQVAAASANAGSAGRWMWHTGSYGVVSDDIDAVFLNQPAGAGLGVITKGYYGLLLAMGDATNALKMVVTGVATMASGDLMIPGDPSQDGTVQTLAAGTEPTYSPLGVVKDTKTGLDTTCTCYVSIGGF